MATATETEKITDEQIQRGYWRSWRGSPASGRTRLAWS